MSGSAGQNGLSVGNGAAGRAVIAAAPATEPRDDGLGLSSSTLPELFRRPANDATPLTQEQLEQEIDLLSAEIKRINTNLDSVIVGMDRARRFLLISPLVGRHMLLEGAPGLAKTLLCQSFADSLGLSFQRIQFTPDLTANDIVGFQRPTAGGTDFEFVKGPIFANVVLAVEINRSPGKTQSALLQAMQEGEVTVDRETYQLPTPFIVLATQNPLEISQATYALPDAQLDRFGVKMGIEYPNRDELIEIQVRDTAGVAAQVKQLYTQEEAEMLFRRGRELARGVQIEPEIHAAVAELCLSLNPMGPPDYQVEAAKNGNIIRGPSPRAAGTLLRYAQGVALLEGRSYVVREDVREVVLPVLRHRVELSPDVIGDVDLNKIIEDAAETFLRNV